MEEQIEQLENRIAELEKKLQETTNLLRNHRHQGQETVSITEIIAQGTGLSITFDKGQGLPKIQPVKGLAVLVPFLVPIIPSYPSLGDASGGFSQLYIGSESLNASELASLKALI